MEGEVVLKMTKRLTIILLVMTLALAVAGAPAWAANAAAGKTVYTSKCQACHAADGSGNQNIAKAMGVTLKPLGGAEVQGMSDDDLKKAITAGKGKMKPVSSVTGADLDNVIAYVRSLKK
jgi:mono/diheme cytochrome c family protein